MSAECCDKQQKDFAAFSKLYCQQTLVLKKLIAKNPETATKTTTMNGKKSNKYGKLKKKKVQMVISVDFICCHLGLHELVGHLKRSKYLAAKGIFLIYT